jgi:esterase/lipase superfamily enzyme
MCKEVDRSMSLKWWGLLCSIVLVFVSSILPHYIHKDATLGYVGSLMSGAISGLLTLLGVIYTIKWYREQDNKAHQEQLKRERTKQVNQLRLLLAELNNNRTLLRAAQMGDTEKLTRIQDFVWMKLQTELDWLDQYTFTSTFDLYAALKEVRYRSLNQLDTDLDYEKTERYVQAIDNIRGSIIKDFPTLNEPLPLSGNS